LTPPTKSNGALILSRKIEISRSAVIHEMTRMKPVGPLYYSGSTVVAAIDAHALMLTGQRDYFALEAHSVGGARDGA
jgi:hypothetical protein